MKIYVDLLFFLNLFFDFNLLLTVNNALKRYIKLKRIFLSSLVGALTTFTLFLSFDTFWLMVLKIGLGIVMCLIAFGMKDIKYCGENIIYFFMTSMVLGGFLYFFLLTIQEEHRFLSFTYKNLTSSMLFLFLLSPFMLYIYQKQKKECQKKDHIYPVKIGLTNKQVLHLVGYLDSGNRLEDPITKKKIILVDSKKVPKSAKAFVYYVPYNSLNHHGLLSCIKIEYLEIYHKKSSKYLVGISQEKLFSNGISCVLNESCLEEIL